MAPATNAALAGTQSGSAFVGSVRVTLAATDKSSGVAGTSYSLNGGSSQTYTAPFTISVPGTYTLLYFSKDVAGNIEATHSKAFTIVKSSTTTKVVSSLNPTTFGLNVAFTVTVTPSGGIAPTGTVSVKDGSTILGTVSLSNGRAILLTNALHAGSHTITAVYAGSGSDTGSTSAALTETVNKVATKVTLASSPDPSIRGSSVTFTARILPASGTSVSGTVIFKAGATTLGTAAVNTTTHAATLASSAVRVGTSSITAVYGGSADLNGSTSSGLTQVVNKANTKTTLVSSINPSTHGSPVTFTATVVPSSGAPVSGVVTFKGGTATLGTAAVNTSTHAATFTTSALTVGTTSITAVYGGSADLNGSTSAALSQAVK